MEHSARSQKLESSRQEIEYREELCDSFVGAAFSRDLDV